MDTKTQITMKRILIDLPEDIHKALRHKAVEAGTSLKPFIEFQLRRLIEKKQKGKTYDPLDI